MRNPIIKEKIYVPSSIYVYRGRDDFMGGLATIDKIEYNERLPEDHVNYIMIGIEERPNVMYNWKLLLEKQNDLAEEYKNNIAHPDPDYSDEFNCHPNADWESL